MVAIKVREVKVDLAEAIEEAETKAWEALARYKFHMFGYWSAIWVHLNIISGEKRPNPWKNLVDIAKKIVQNNT